MKKIVIHNVDSIFDSTYIYPKQVIKKGDLYWKNHTENIYQVIFRIGKYLISKKI